MVKLSKFARRLTLVAGLLMMTATSSGCYFALPLVPFNVLLFEDLSGMMLNYARFWKTTPLIPVSPYFSRLAEVVLGGPMICVEGPPSR